MLCLCNHGDIPGRDCVCSGKSIAGLHVVLLVYSLLLALWLAIEFLFFVCMDSIMSNSILVIDKALKDLTKLHNVVSNSLMSRIDETADYAIKITLITEFIGINNQFNKIIDDLLEEVKVK